VTAEVGGVSYSSITRRELLQKQRVAEADENLARLLAGATDPSVAMSGTVVLEYPMGFDTKAQFEQATKELRETLKQSGISDVDALGVRGSSATGWSDRKGRAFGPDSDVDYFVESAMATKGLRQSEDIPGFVHPSRLRAAFPLLGRWADRWSGRLGRKVSTGGFAPGTVPAEPAIKVVP